MTIEPIGWFFAGMVWWLAIFAFWNFVKALYRWAQIEKRIRRIERLRDLSMAWNNGFFNGKNYPEDFASNEYVSNEYEEAIEALHIEIQRIKEGKKVNGKHH